MTSIVIAAHNEAAVIGRCLDALLAGAEPVEFDVTVAANGCVDATVSRATRPGVRVLDLPAPGKTGALNAADAVAVGFPRIYLDADSVLTAPDIRALAAALDGPGAPLAVTARRQLDLRGRGIGVRAYYAIHRHLPIYRRALFGRGVIVLSAAARARFDRFPDVIADDLFLDSLFTPAEKGEVSAVTSVVGTPRRSRDLLRRLIRVRAGNTALRAATAPPNGAATVPGALRPPARLSWLRDVVLPRPWLAPAAVGYLTLTLLAERGARRATGATSWDRADSREASS